MVVAIETANEIFGQTRSQRMLAKFAINKLQCQVTISVCDWTQNTICKNGAKFTAF